MIVDATLKISAKGQVTLKKAVLAHLGVQPGQDVVVDMKPNGRVELRPARTGTIADVFGLLKRPGQPTLTIDEINDFIAGGWAGER